MNFELNYTELRILLGALREQMVRLKDLRRSYSPGTLLDERVVLARLNQQIFDLHELMDKLEEAELSL